MATDDDDDDDDNDDDDDDSDDNDYLAYKSNSKVIQLERQG
jgi:hypothetical protein